jgi:hypothetical protein
VKLVHCVNHEATVTRYRFDSFEWWERSSFNKVSKDCAVTCLRCLTLPPTRHKWVDKGVHQ